jgi:hypothetical protein
MWAVYYCYMLTLIRNALVASIIIRVALISSEPSRNESAYLRADSGRMAGTVARRLA